MRRILMVVFVVITTVSVNSQLLWRVSGNGLEKPSYLFGTLHLAPMSVVDSIYGLREVVENVDVVCGEVVAASMQSADTLSYMAGRMVLPGDSTLADLLDAQEFVAVKGFLENRLGIDFDGSGLSKMIPAAITNQITMLVTAESVPGYNPANQLDAGLQSVAKLLGKNVCGLESVRFQIDLIAGVPLERQAEQLLCTVESFDSLVVQSRRLVDAYYSQDLLEIESLMQEDGDSHCGYTQDEQYALIGARNKAWMKKLPKIMGGGSVLFAVGAGHLSCGDGLIALLLDAGYEVEPVEKPLYDRM